MHSMTRTVVAWNGSDAAEAALQWAVRRTPHGVVTVVHSPTDSADPIRRMVLRAKAESTREIHPGLSINAVTLEGDLIEALAEYSDDETLLVVGDRGAVDAAATTASFSARVLAVAQGPVAIIPARSADRHAGPMVRTGVVVQIGHLPSAMPLLTFAAGEAVLAGEDLVILHSTGGGAQHGLEGAARAHEAGLEDRDQIEHALHTLRRMHPLLTIHTVDALRTHPAQILVEARTVDAPGCVPVP